MKTVRVGLGAAVLWLALAVAGPAQAQKLVAWMVGDDKVPRILRPAVAAFQAQHPGLAVEVRDVPWADAMSKYSAALASRTGPDVITGGTIFGVDLGAKGALIDLSQRAPDLLRLLIQYADADCGVLMDAGRIVDRARHAELLARCELFRRLWQVEGLAK